MKSSKISHEKWNVWMTHYVMIIPLSNYSTILGKWNVWMTHYFMIIPLNKHSTTLGIISICVPVTVLSLIRDNQKFQFCKKTVTFTGLNITPSGISSSSNILSAIRDFPVPQNITGAQSWFGLVNQVAWAHSISEIKQPFRELIKPNSKFLWTAELGKLFNDTKALIISKVERGVQTFYTKR